MKLNLDIWRPIRRPTELELQVQLRASTETETVLHARRCAPPQQSCFLWRSCSHFSSISPAPCLPLHPNTHMILLQSTGSVVQQSMRQSRVPVPV